MTKQEAIEMLKTICGDCRLFPKCVYKKSECFTAIDMAIEALTELDNNSTKVDNKNDELSCSAFPNRSEPLTDKEQRIFLAAMGREEKVCKEVDEECRDCREPYEDSLVRICHEITRKVKGALWTI